MHVNGKRAVYLAILKHADASTLAVVDAAREALPEIQAAAPAGLELKLDFDQSVFVRAAVQNVIREAIISSILVSRADPGVPGKLAQHGDRLHLDPAVDLRRHHGPVPHRQHAST